MVCVAGFALSLAFYVASFFSVVVDDVFTILLGLGIVIFVSVAAIYATPKADLNNMFFFQQLNTRTPRTLRRAQLLIFALFLFSFAWFLFRSEASSPTEKNGEYFLNNHGKIGRTLTKTEYMHLKADELRIFATGFMSAYSVVFGYWTVLAQERSEP